jgi:hypothetical protein
MPTHSELISIPIHDGQYRLCPGRIQNGDWPFALVWRGTTVSPDGFNPRCAYFDLELLGRLLRQAVTQESLSDQEIDLIRKRHPGDRDDNWVEGERTVGV